MDTANPLASDRQIRGAPQKVPVYSLTTAARTSPLAAGAAAAGPTACRARRTPYSLSSAATHPPTHSTCRTPNCEPPASPTIQWQLELWRPGALPGLFSLLPLPQPPPPPHLRETSVWVRLRRRHPAVLCRTGATSRAAPTSPPSRSPDQTRWRGGRSPPSPAERAGALAAGSPQPCLRGPHLYDSGLSVPCFGAGGRGCVARDAQRWLGYRGKCTLLRRAVFLELCCFLLVIVDLL